MNTSQDCFGMPAARTNHTVMLFNACNAHNTRKPLMTLMWKNQLAKVRRISAEFTKMARRICKFCTEFSIFFGAEF